MSFFVKSLLNSILSVTSTLSQVQTNGLSIWGTLSQPTFPLFLTNNPLPSGFPWGTMTAAGNDPTRAPYTGVTRSYIFDISRGTIAPDGYQKNVLLVNGQFPGPAIEANWGDTIQVTINNHISNPEEGVAFHWHGLLQYATPYYDGVPAVSQCPVAPSKSFTYTFSAAQYGSTWYHSHYSAQYSGGLWGPLIIHGPSHVSYDIDIGPVMLSDYYHKDYLSIVSEVVSQAGPNFNPAPFSDNNLINGKMSFDCSTVQAGDTTPCSSSAGVSSFKFQSGKVHRLRLINTGSEGIQRFTIDNHQMTVISNDFVPIVPYSTSVVTLGIGQRADVLVKATLAPTAAVWMRANISTICSKANQPNALAAIYYQNADTTKAPTSIAANLPDPGTCANDDISGSVPYFKQGISTPAITKTMNIATEFNATGYFLWTFDGVSFRGDYNAPLYEQVNKGNLTFAPEWNVKNMGSATSFRVIVNNNSPAAHPMHLHGHNMQVLSVGAGAWDGTIVNSANPSRRDVQLLPVDGHLVWQVNADNPGVWPFHCHIAWHVSGGLYSSILERPADIAKVVIPSTIQDSCTSWNAFTASQVIDQIDSGV